jgi:hypothetical protein
MNMRTQTFTPFLGAFILFFGSVPVTYADLAHPLTVDLPVAMHFLNPGGKDVVLPANIVSQYLTGLGNFSRQYLRNAYLSGLKNKGYHQGKRPVGWPGGLRLDRLLSTLTSTCQK